VCSTISNTVITTCDIAGVGEVQTAPCAPGSASTVGSNTAIDTCTTKPSDSSYTTVGSCAWACDAAYKSFDGATCVLTTSPTPYPTAYPTANPTGSPTPCELQVSQGWLSNYVNGWDGGHDSTCGNLALTGLKSHHDNGREDRLMQFRCGTLAAGITTGGLTTLPETNWDGDWVRQCPPNSYMTGFSSHHDNGREDRKFTFKCVQLTNPGVSGTQDPAWSGWQNTYDNQLDYSSGANKFITAIHSIHHNGYEDRVFQFKTSTFSSTSC